MHIFVILHFLIHKMCNTYLNILESEGEEKGAYGIEDSMTH
jgi:hypothetical protein